MKGNTAFLVATLTIATSAVFGGAFYGLHLLLAALFLALAIGIGFMERGWILKTDECVLIAGILWAAVVAVARPEAPLTAKTTLSYWMIACCLWIGFRRTGEQAKRRVFTTVLSAALIIAGVIVGGAMLKGSLRNGGAFDSPNVAASVLLGAVPLVAFPSRKWVGRWPALGLIGLALLITGSRAAWVAVAVAIVVGLERKRLRLVSAIVGGSAVIAALLLRNLLHPEGLAWFRPRIWMAVLGIVSDHPLTGVGPGGLAEAAGIIRICHAEDFAQYERIISFSESSPLAVLVQTGAIGVALFSLAGILALVDLRRKGVWASPQARAAIAGIVTFSLFHDVLTIPVTLWWWALVLGVLLANECVDERSETPTNRLRIVTSLSIVGLVLWGLAAPAYAEWSWQRGDHGPAEVEAALRAEPLFVDAARWRVQELLALDTWDWTSAAEALHWADCATRRHRGDAGTWALLARVRSRAALELGAGHGAIQGSRDAFRIASEREPFLPWYWYGRAQLERGIGNLEAARALAAKSVNLEPNFVRGHLLLGRLELDHGRVDEARAALARAQSIVDVGMDGQLTAYQSELIACPAWQVTQLSNALK
ncbi:MAG: hypothetical protein GY906_00535 [bacterium]|nr:hypothetical protein [bacterium]